MPKSNKSRVIRRGATLAQSGLEYLGDADKVRRTLWLEDVSVRLDQIAGILNPLAEDIGRELDRIYGKERVTKWS